MGEEMAERRGGGEGSFDEVVFSGLSNLFVNFWGKFCVCTVKWDHLSNLCVNFFVCYGEKWYVCFYTFCFSLSFCSEFPRKSFMNPAMNPARLFVILLVSQCISVQSYSIISSNTHKMKSHTSHSTTCPQSYLHSHSHSTIPVHTYRYNTPTRTSTTIMGRIYDDSDEIIDQFDTHEKDYTLEMEKAKDEDEEWYQNFIKMQESIADTIDDSDDIDELNDINELTELDDLNEYQDEYQDDYLDEQEIPYNAPASPSPSPPRSPRSRSPPPLPSPRTSSPRRPRPSSRSSTPPRTPRTVSSKSGVRRGRTTGRSRRGAPRPTPLPPPDPVSPIWPTLRSFKKLLKSEAEFRLSVLGPWASSAVREESEWRLGAYEGWLRCLDEGIGEKVLEEDVVYPWNGEGGGGRKKREGGRKRRKEGGRRQEGGKKRRRKSAREEN